VESRGVMHAPRWCRASLLACVLGSLLVASSALAAGAWPPRFECTLVDGSVRTLTQDLALAFKQSVRGCVALPARGEDLAPSAEPLAPAYPAWRPGPSPVLPGTLPALPIMSAPPTLAGRVQLPDAAQALIHKASARYGLDPGLVSALVYVESRGHAHARSPKGALGLMQIMPGTGKRYGVHTRAELLDPATNVDAGVRYLRDLLLMFQGRIDLSLAAYNAGEGAVARYGNRIPPYAETQSYVRKILEHYRARPVRSAE
jgi:soluble lytic murein transglycosylase-like protein